MVADTNIKGRSRTMVYILNHTGLVHGFRLWDKVLCNGKEGFITGRRTSGFFVVKQLNGTTLSAGISYKRLKLLEKGTNYITERWKAIPLRLTLGV